MSRRRFRPTRIAGADSCVLYGVGLLLLSAVAGCFGGGRGGDDVRESDSPAVVALKNAGAEIRLLPIPSANTASLRIDLSGIELTPEIIDNLLNAEGVVELIITGPGVTDAIMERLGGLKSLSLLDLSESSVTNAGLAHLTELPSLVSITLNDTQVSGEGLAHLPSTVATLMLANTEIGDSDLEQTNHLRRLKFVNLAGTRVTATGANRLKRGRSSLLIMGVKLK